jgi:hypothetical protein
MWNKLTELARDQSNRRLLLALLISVFLHYILFGKLDLSLPSTNQDIQVIDARLQISHANAQKLDQTNLSPNVVKPKKVKPKQEKLKKEAPNLTKVNEEKSAEPSSPQPASETLPENPVPEASVDSSPPLDEPEPVNEELPIETGLVINENAYKYVETHFDVRTKVDGPIQGKATAVFNAIDNEHYKLNFLIEVDGVVAFLIPNLLQTSDGQITKSGLQPNNYMYQFGNKLDKNRKAIFDWQAKTLQMISNNETKTESLVDGTQDVISFMYQFMYVAPLQKMELNITNGKKLREYDYAFEGEENINTPFGEIKTYHIAHTGSDNDEKIELWLAEDYQYIPVKIRKIDKEGRMYEFTANRINTNHPLLP